MKQYWNIEPECEFSQQLQDLSALQNQLVCQGETINRSSKNEMMRLRLSDSAHIYVKKYHTDGSWLRRLFGQSRLSNEWRNLNFFRRLGIPTPPILAVGEQRNRWRYRWGILVTLGIENALDLKHLLQHFPERFRHRPWLGTVADQVLTNSKKLHDQRFIHGDLKFRNILVQNWDTATPKVYFIDCPSGWRRRGYFFKRGLVKELYQLDKYAATVLSKSERLRLYFRYRGGVARLTERDKMLLRQIHQRYAHDRCQ